MDAPFPASSPERASLPIVIAGTDEPPPLPGGLFVAPPPVQVEPEPPPLPMEETPPLPGTTSPPFDALELDEPPALPRVEETPPLPEHGAVRQDAAPVVRVLAEEPPGLPGMLSSAAPTPVVVVTSSTPRAHLSITAFIAVGFIIPSFLPLFGIIAAVLVYALSTAVLKATWGGPIYSFSKVLAITCQVIGVTVIVLQSIYIMFLAWIFFASYREFMDEVHTMLSLQQDQLNFVKEVWHYFTG
jgi:hypothetical protein